jgi:DNA-binding winged helix-turn-helix (wHTH) protein
MSFSPFHVLPNQRLLKEGDQLIRLGSQALDPLVALVERAGELAAKAN